MDNPHIFVSYTLRGGHVSRNTLERLKRKMASVGLTRTYIDLLDNQGRDPQQYVMDRLENADILLVIHSSEISSSEWVKLEIETAARQRKKKIMISVEELEAILEMSPDELRKNSVILQLMKV